MSNPDSSVLKILSGNRLFSDLDDKEMGRLIHSNCFRVKNCPKDTLVMSQGDLYDQLYFVAEGTLTASFQRADGKSILAERLTFPTVVASAILFSREKKLPVTLTAETDVVLVSISLDNILRLFQQNSSVLHAYLQDMGEKVVFLADKIRYLQMNSLKQKVLSFLLDQARIQSSESIKLPYSQEVLAELFGVTRPSLSRCLMQLTDQGLIQRKGKSICIPDTALLLDEFED